MPSRAVKAALYLIPILILLIFVVWMEVSPYQLAPMTIEDGWIENGTAIGFAVGAVAFALAAWRVPLLRNGAKKWAPAMTICWALLSFVCMGEEISWGQRIFNFSTPEVVKEENIQGEFNLHNMTWMDDDALGGKYRFISLYLLLGGLGIPLAARIKWGKSLAKSTYFPVLPWCYSALWVGAYIYGKYYSHWYPIPNLHPAGAPSEIRELMMGVGTAFFGIHALLWPSEVYITRQNEAGAAAIGEHASSATV